MKKTLQADKKAPCLAQHEHVFGSHIIELAFQVLYLDFGVGQFGNNSS
jgi:hypothetical protein